MLTVISDIASEQKLNNLARPTIDLSSVMKLVHEQLACCLFKHRLTTSSSNIEQDFGGIENKTNTQTLLTFLTTYYRAPPPLHTPPLPATATQPKPAPSTPTLFV